MLIDLINGDFTLLPYVSVFRVSPIKYLGGDALRLYEYPVCP